jgi:hypothetical protein
MKANELRIGNIIQCGGIEIEIGKINENFISFNVSKNNELKIWNPYIPMNDERLKSIPITEEWLWKFGFKILNSNWYVLGNFKLNNSFDVEWGTNWMGIRLIYVHQLQNLFLALTGEELKIK